MTESGRVMAYIAFGGNVGDVAASFRMVLDELESDSIRVASVSQLFTTMPVGISAGADYLNGAIAVATTLDAESLLTRLQQIETSLGRVRDKRWGPRTVDLDLIMFGDAVLKSERLSVPHPAWWYRRFVLDPLAEIASDAIDPVSGQTVTSVRSRLLVRPLPIQIGAGLSDATRLSRMITQRFGSRVALSVAETLEESMMGISFEVATANSQVISDIGSIFRVWMPATADVTQVVTDVLTAALDEPRPVDPSDLVL